MLIIPEISPTRLRLAVFSYEITEINIVSSFLNEKELAYTSRPLPKSNDRLGMEFLIIGARYIQLFQSALHINFKGRGRDVQVDFLKDDGAPFCCKKIAQNNWESENETIYAPDDQAALIKCSLLANNRNWVGGVSERGACKRD